MANIITEEGPIIIAVISTTVLLSTQTQTSNSAAAESLEMEALVRIQFRYLEIDYEMIRNHRWWGVFSNKVGWCYNLRQLTLGLL